MSAVSRPKTATSEDALTYFSLLLQVDENNRSQKIGKNLMLKTQDIYRQKGGSKMTWSVLSTNYRAQKFYQSIGTSYNKDWHLYSKEVKISCN